MADTPDPAETDPEGLSSAEDLDEDRLRLDPLEAGMDPPEHWSAAMAHPTAREERTGESLDERLAEEQPDAAPPPEPVDEVDRMDADGELSGRPTDGELPFARDTDLRTPEGQEGRTADEGAGSVARELRTPRE